MTLTKGIRFSIILGLSLILGSPGAWACAAGQARELVENFFADYDYACETSEVSERTNGIFSDDYYSVKFFCEGSPLRSQTMYVYIGDNNRCYLK